MVRELGIFVVLVMMENVIIEIVVLLLKVFYFRLWKYGEVDKVLVEVILILLRDDILVLVLFSWLGRNLLFDINRNEFFVV